MINIFFCSLSLLNYDFFYHLHLDGICRFFADGFLISRIDIILSTVYNNYIKSSNAKKLFFSK
jgi:hypothetical protein